MENVQFLAIKENRAAVRAISERVLAEIEPDELEISVGFIDPLIDMAAGGEIVTVDTSDEAGSFGGADLMVMVVVPLVVAVLGDLLTKLGELGIEELKKKLKRNKEARTIAKITVGDIEAVVRRIKSPRASRRTKELARTVNVVLLEYLEAD